MVALLFIGVFWLLPTIFMFTWLIFAHHKEGCYAGQEFSDNEIFIPLFPIVNLMSCFLIINSRWFPYNNCNSLGDMIDLYKKDCSNLFAFHKCVIKEWKKYYYGTDKYVDGNEIKQKITRKILWCEKCHKDMGIE